MSRDELQRQSLEAALGDVGIARVEFDDVAGWVVRDTLSVHPGGQLSNEYPGVCWHRQYRPGPELQ